MPRASRRGPYTGTVPNHGSTPTAAAPAETAPGPLADDEQPAVLVRRLRKEFPAAGSRRTRGGRTVCAVDGVSLSARAGAVTALLGTNGAGKTTTLSCAQGLVRPSSGIVRLLGEDPWRAGPQLRARVGIMLQDGGLPQAIRPVPLLHHVASMYEDPVDMDALIRRLGIDEFDGTTIRRLSGGQRQRVSLAAALAGGPEVLFLDEPSAGLDPHSRKVVFDLIREVRAAGTAVVLTTHLMDDAERLADQVYIMDAGKVVLEGTVDQLLAGSRDAQALVFTLPRCGLGIEDLLPHELRAGLTLSEDSPGAYTLTGPLGPAHLAALTAGWERQDVLPTHLELTPRSLEDLFLDISEGERS